MDRWSNIALFLFEYFPYFLTLCDSGDSIGSFLVYACSGVEDESRDPNRPTISVENDMDVKSRTFFEQHGCILCRGGMGELSSYICAIGERDDRHLVMMLHHQGIGVALQEAIHSHLVHVEIRADFSHSLTGAI